MATTLYRRGRVRTPDRPDATAFVVVDARVGWVGDEQGAESHADVVDAVVDLEGCLVLPAFVDAHAHLSHTGMGLRGVDLAGTTSVCQALRAVEDAARRRGGRPVFALNWQEHDWAEDRALTAAELDRASFGGVVYASRIDGHSAVVSSALAMMSGADRLDGWSGDGLVTRDAKNAARAAFDAARSAEQRREDVEDALRAAAAQGIAVVHECGGPLLTSAADFADVLDARPATRTCPARSATGPRRSPTPSRPAPWWRCTAPRGWPATSTSTARSARTPPTCGPTTPTTPAAAGTAYRSSADVRDHVAACAVAGIQSGFHVIGDAGMDTVLAGYEAAADLVGLDVVRATRPRLEHAEMVDADGIAPWRASAWSPASSRPSTRSGAAPPGCTRPAWAGTGCRAPTRSPALAAAGVRLALGSDSPVTPFDPWAAVRAAVEHHQADQRLDVATAVDAHTAGGHAAAREDGGGVLRVGGPATFAVWDVPQTGRRRPSRGARWHRPADLPAHRARRGAAHPGMSSGGRQSRRGSVTDSGAPTPKTSISWASIV